MSAITHRTRTILGTVAVTLCALSFTASAQANSVHGIIINHSSHAFTGFNVWSATTVPVQDTPVITKDTWGVSPGQTTTFDVSTDRDDVASWFSLDEDGDHLNRLTMNFDVGILTSNEATVGDHDSNIVVKAHIEHGYNVTATYEIWDYQASPGTQQVGEDPNYQQSPTREVGGDS